MSRKKIPYHLDDLAMVDVLNKMDAVQDAPKTLKTILEVLGACQDQLLDKKKAGGITPAELQQLARVTAALLWLQSQQTELPF